MDNRICMHMQGSWVLFARNLDCDDEITTSTRQASGDKPTSNVGTTNRCFISTNKVSCFTTNIHVYH